MLSVKDLLHTTDMTKTPFVNREREIVELALTNAYFIHQIQTCGAKNIHSWRYLFAAQMYGAGKTRIGIEFMGQVASLLKENKNEVFKKYCRKVWLQDLPELLLILEKFCRGDIRYFDLRIHILMLTIYIN